jgi:polysaccharide biosynthesis protein PslH
MRILLLSNKFPFPPNDGGALATYNMIRGLAEAGNDIDLLLMNTSKHFTEYPESKTDIPGLGKVKIVNVDNSVKFLSLAFNFLFSTIPYNVGRFTSHRFKCALKELVKNNNYEIVQLEGLFLAPYLKLIRENSTAAIVYRAHNVEHLIWQKLFIRENNFLKKWYLRVLYSRIKKYEMGFINSYDLLVTITGNDLDILNSLGNTKPAFASPFGMYSMGLSEKNGIRQGNLCVLYIGALDWMPNIEALRWFVKQVWPVVRKRFPEMVFRIAGRNAKKDLVTEIAEKGVICHGEVDNSGEFLASENGIVVVPLFSGSGIRVRIIEAMFAGRPVIASSVAASGIPVENEINILLADDCERFVHYIEKLVIDREFGKIISDNARQFANKNYENEKISYDLLDFYKKSLL